MSESYTLRELVGSVAYDAARARLKQRQCTLRAIMYGAFMAGLLSILGVAIRLFANEWFAWYPIFVAAILGFTIRLAGKGYSWGYRILGVVYLAVVYLGSWLSLIGIAVPRPSEMDAVIFVVSLCIVWMLSARPLSADSIFEEVQVSRFYREGREGK